MYLKLIQNINSSGDSVLFGSSGIRRVMNDESMAFFSDVSKAIGTFFNGGKVCVGCDIRNSSEALKDIVKKSLMSTGVDVIDIGVVPTPLLAFASKYFDGGIMITASHNPPEWNGIKVFSGGMGIGKNEQELIEKIFMEKEYRHGSGKERHQDFLDDYENAIMDFLKRKGIKIRDDLHILIDPGNGAMSRIAKKILADIGMNVDSINDRPDGNFPNRLSEPKKETLSRAIELSKDYDFAACFDGDGDRVVFCDGKFFGYNEGIAAVSKMYGAKKIVTTVESGSLLDEVGDVIRVPVGDVNVAEGVRDYGADIGVEQVGHYIFPEFGLFPETIIPIVIFASKFEERNINAKFYFQKTSIRTSNKKKSMEKISSIFSGMNPKKLIKIDGIRAEFDFGWALVRPSGTEPLIRLMVETNDQGRTEGMIKELKKKISEMVE